MKPLAHIVDFVMEQAPTQPVAKRAQLYRNLAAIAGSRRRAAAFIALASELESIDRRAKQLRLDLGDGSDGNGGAA